MNDTIQNYVIDSRNRAQGTSSNFRIIFDQPIQKISKVKLLHCSIPSTHYNVRTDYNTLIFNEGGPNLTATMTDGAYTIADLQAEIKLQMEAVGANTYTVTYDARTMKLTITATGNFSIIGTLSDSFLDVTGYDAIDTTSALSHTANDVVDLHPFKYAQIEIPELSLIGSSNNNTKFTFIVPIEVNRSDVHFFNAEDNFNQFTLSSQCNINYLSVIVKDQDNNIVDLNGAPWFMILNIQ